MGDLIAKLREEARADAKIQRAVTDGLYGPNYESVAVEQTTKWKAADALAAAGARLAQLQDEVMHGSHREACQLVQRQKEDVS